MGYLKSYYGASLNRTNVCSLCDSSHFLFWVQWKILLFIITVPGHCFHFTFTRVTTVQFIKLTVEEVMRVFDNIEINVWSVLRELLCC